MQVTSIECGGVRIHLRQMMPMLREAPRWIDLGARPPLHTVNAAYVVVSTRPNLWPSTIRDYRGSGRLGWVG